MVANFTYALVCLPLGCSRLIQSRSSFSVREDGGSDSGGANGSGDLMLVILPLLLIRSFAPPLVSLPVGCWLGSRPILSRLRPVMMMLLLLLLLLMMMMMMMPMMPMMLMMMMLMMIVMIMMMMVMMVMMIQSQAVAHLKGREQKAVVRFNSSRRLKIVGLQSRSVRARMMDKMWRGDGQEGLLPLSVAVKAVRHVITF
ncbi:hypothetical protein CBR_g49923 [Chara braunii]|uniref:Uncharacterized protein n=1 Tax=Chara braunii TaxID=69332 RepID=A0A388JPB0_CHABU|nr:hypothetical protein CBR_g49923 [Chara braunii]|eukprot:GBG59659.1 hypothetical protein CBR_g49923 [Chara braunii]